MVVLCAGFSSCEKDSIAPIDSITTDSIFFPTPSQIIDKVFAEYIKNSSNITCKSQQNQNDSILLSGIKNKHLWFAFFDKNTKTQISEWIDIEETDTIQRVHKGYGEYETFTIRTVLPTILKQTNDDFIASIGFGSASILVFNKNKKIKKTDLFKERVGKLWNWYKESILINNCCYTSEGDTLFTYEDRSVDNGLDYKTNPLGIPISYYEGIYVNRSSERLCRTNFNPKMCSNKGWGYSLSNGVSDIFSCDFNIPFDCKWTCDLIKKNNNLWKYKITTITKDGNKDYYDFDINIENAYTVHENAEIIGVWNKHYGSTNTFKLILNSDNTYTSTFKEHSFSKKIITNGSYIWDKSKSQLILSNNTLFPFIDLVKLTPTEMRLNIEKDFFPVLKKE